MGRTRVYTNDEAMWIVDGELRLRDATGQEVVAHAGDLMFFPEGSSISFETPSTSLGYFCSCNGPTDCGASRSNDEALRRTRRMLHYQGHLDDDIYRLAVFGMEDSTTPVRFLQCSDIYEDSQYIVDREFCLSDGM